MQRERRLEQWDDLKPDPEEESTGDCEGCILPIVISSLATFVFVFVLFVFWQRFCKTRQVNNSRRLNNHSQVEISTIRPPPYEYPIQCCHGNELVQRNRRMGNYNPMYIPDFPTSNHNRPFRYLANENTLSNQRCNSFGHPANENTARDEEVLRRSEQNNLNTENVESTAADEPDTSPMEVACPYLFNHSLSRLMEETERSVRTKVGDKLVVYITRRVDHKGDYLILDNMGISLYVPPLAVKEGQEQLITLVLNWDLGDNPNMTDNESLVSPVVYVGPHGLKLEKPCRLIYKHCSFDTRQVQVLKSETEIIDQKDWKILCNREDDSGTCVLTQDECQLQINSFTLFTCIQSPLEGERSKKWLQLAVFSCSLQSSVDHHQVRIYFLNKTPCALQWAIQNEAQFGGKLICPEKVFLFHGNDMDAFVTLRYLCDGWQKVDEDESERVQFLNVWHGKCPHVCICFKKSRLHVSELNFQIYVNQETLENEGEKVIVHAMEDPNANEQRPFMCSRHREEIIVQQKDGRTVLDFSSDAGPSHCRNLRFVVDKSEPEIPLDEFTSSVPDDCFLPHHVKTELKYLLDPRSRLGNDWQALAAKLGFDKCIRILESVPSPTEVLLKEFERKRITFYILHDALCDIGRLDAANVIQQHIQEIQEKRTRSTCRRTPVETCDSTGYFNNGSK